MVVKRRNVALLAQVGVGTITAAFVVATALAPFGTVSFFLGTALTTAATLGAVALLFEVLMLPFGASAFGVRIHRCAVPWAMLGVLGSASVVFGAFEFGPPGHWTIWTLRLATPVTVSLSIGLCFYRPT